MTKNPLIAPSILSADFAHLADEISRVTHNSDAEANADWLHVDVMDGHFVPNLTLGLPVVKAIIETTSIPIDCHLMIEDPLRWAPEYAKLGVHNVSIHAEAVTKQSELKDTAHAIHDNNALAGIAIKLHSELKTYEKALSYYDTVLIMSVEPGFGGQKFIPTVLNKVKELRSRIDKEDLNIVIEIDGGINLDTIAQAAEAGVDCFVAGSSIYGVDNPGLAIEQLRRKAIRSD